MRTFISYSHQDEKRQERLKKHLSILERKGCIETWFDRKILAGSVIDAEIKEQIESAELFLLLVSPDFLASGYCYDWEMSRALERHHANDARVVPIIVESCDWKNTPLGELKALPCDGRPIASWDNENAAYLDIVEELRRIITHRAPEAANQRGEDLARIVDVPPRGPMYRSSRDSAPGQFPDVETQPRGIVGPDHVTADAEPGLGEPHNGGTATPTTKARRYRMKRDFDAIERAKFREAAYATIRKHFEREVGELTSHGDVQARIVLRSATAFSCTIVNKALARGTAHITVHSRGGEMGFTDISFAYAENSPPTIAHGFLSIDNDEYELYLLPSMMTFGDNRDRLTPLEAAEMIWKNFIEQAGISCC